MYSETRSTVLAKFSTSTSTSRFPSLPWLAFFLNFVLFCDGVLSKIHGSDLGFSTDPVDLSHANATFARNSNEIAILYGHCGGRHWLSVKTRALKVLQRCSLDSDRYSHFLDDPRGRSTANEITPFDYGYPTRCMHTRPDT